MRLTRLGGAALSALACLTLLAPTTAGAQRAGTPREIPVDVTFGFEYTTTWNAPAFMRLKDSYHEFWTEGKGSETYKLKERRPWRMAFRWDRVNGWGIYDVPTKQRSRGGFPLSGPHTRSREWRSWATGPDGFDERHEGDCGTRLPSLEVHVMKGTNGFYPSMGRDFSVSDGTGEGFQDCEVVYPKGGPGSAWNLRGKEIADRTIASRRSFSIQDAQTWKWSAPAGERPMTSESTLRWKLTFTRAKKGAERPRAPKRGRGRSRRG